ncbi:MAG: heparan-alpha-glucosaminide N-acetyltransferase domain-containing protein [Promethearchaeia archaeon]
MKRLKSIDVFRGFAMTWMVVAHLLGWWLQEDLLWLFRFSTNAFDFIGAAAFIFISGVSVALSTKKKLTRDGRTRKKIRNIYLLKAAFVFILAICYNLAIAVVMNDYTLIWTWYVLLTISVSLFLGWPLLKVPKAIRILIGIVIWIVNQFLFHWLVILRASSQVAAVFYHLFYNGLTLDPILSFFPFFLFGTAIGEIVFQIINTENNYYARYLTKTKLIYPIALIGPALILTGIIYQFPAFFDRGSFSWMIYSLGMMLIIFTALLSIEVFEKINTRLNYRIFYYYSYYSLSIFLIHNLLYFIFLGSLNLVWIWFAIITTFFSVGFLLKVIHKRWGAKASIKYQLGRLAVETANIIEERMENELSLLERIQRKINLENY